MSTPNSAKVSGLRLDIQALRGLAVLLVVMFHADVSLFRFGYLGVDIFFVISGFLITTQIVKAIARGSFSFRRFYYRRAMRLLPAAYVLLIICIALAPLFLHDPQLVDFSEQAIGAFSFTSNFVLLNQIGYFDTDAAYKPLLHFWSLSLEEQYYLLIPILLVVAGQWRLKLFVLLVVISLSLYVWFQKNNPEYAFYLLSMRLWELGLGSILALIFFRSAGRPEGAVRNGLALISALILVLVPVAWEATDLPSWIGALFVCLASVGVIAAQASWLNSGWIVNRMASLGTISYSVYLVHWPVFAFLHNANHQGGLWWPIRLTAIAASIAGGALLFYWVEQRFRIVGHVTKIGRRQLVLLILLPVVVSAGLGLQRYDLKSNSEYRRLAAVVGLSENCDESALIFTAECQSGSDPRILVWGDSYARHLVPGLLASENSAAENRHIAQATKNWCAPILGVGVSDSLTLNLAKAKTCHEFNVATMQHIAADPHIEIVILSGLWNYLLNNPDWVLQDGQWQLLQLSVEQLVEKFGVTVAQLHEKGKKVVLIAPPVSPGFDAGQCVLNKHSYKIRFGTARDCIVKRDRTNVVNSFLEQVELKNIAPIYRFEEALCVGNACVTEINGVLIYHDAGHFSREGSIYLGRRDDWMNEFVRLAR